MEAWGDGDAEAHTALRDAETTEHETRTARPSLVDGAETAVRDWLAPGHYRRGDRLPPEYELAAMLGISRGTLRSALRRLELTGEIVRRQGSGTFVGLIDSPASLGLQHARVSSYALRAGTSEIAIEVTSVRIDYTGVGGRAAAALHIGARERTTMITREIAADGMPSAVKRDVFHPSVRLLSTEELGQTLRDGTAVIDVLLATHAAMSFARTTISPRLVTAQERDGRLLALAEPTACLEAEMVILDPDGEPLLYSCDLITPGALQIEVVESVGSPDPVPVVDRRSAPLHAARGAREARVRS